MKSRGLSLPFLLLFLILFTLVSCGKNDIPQDVPSVSVPAKSTSVPRTVASNALEELTAVPTTFPATTEKITESTTAFSTEKAGAPAISAAKKAETTTRLTTKKRGASFSVTKEPVTQAHTNAILPASTQAPDTTALLPTSVAATSKTQPVPSITVKQTTVHTTSPTMPTAKRQVHIAVNCRHAVEYGAANLPQTGIMAEGDITVNNGESALNALKSLLAANNIPIQESRGYIKSIGGLKEKDCGGTSGWMYAVNGTSPMVSADKYILSSGDSIIFYYVTNYGDTY